MKFLVTSGCSFSIGCESELLTWPLQLAIMLPKYQHIGTGLGSQGNGIISRKIIYQVSKLLKTAPAENILVGIMWSGPSRHDFYCEDINFSHNIDSWMENPTEIIDNQKNWIIVNHGWNNQFAKQYYSNFYSHIGSLIYTCEHILRTQWFLKLHNIKYFMSTYTGEVFPKEVENREVDYLYNQIDFNQFLPVKGEYEWCRDYSGIEFPYKNDQHPGSNQHLAFTEQIIIPFLQDKKYI